MSEKITPIKASEILQKKAETIPDAMIRAVNELIAIKWNGYEAKIRKDDLLERYFTISGQRNDQANRDELYDRHYMDFEMMYYQEGWKVRYDSPQIGEQDFEPFYTFTVDKFKQASE